MSDERGANEAGANRLAAEGSAYLRQHRTNPVDWYPWGAEALERARELDRPLLVSIGYSACHWCHVMEHESFRDADVAALMNESFVNIKVDREERPDVDRVYMDYLVRSQGQGGWPLTVFCTPEGRPFFAGTYFPPEARHGLPPFRQVLESIARTFRERRDTLEHNAASIVEQLKRRPDAESGGEPGAHTLEQAATRLMQNADGVHGGFGSAPKFPTPTTLDALLAAVDVLPVGAGTVALDHVVFTCREMARRGLFDHLGGGFHRYCVDETWTIPHFEKMLCDQGLLLGTYAEALRRSGDPDLEWPLRETAAYLEREMQGASGGYCASQDADSEGAEGRFYVFNHEEVGELLGPRAAAFATAYGIRVEGNFEEGTTHLNDIERAPRERFREERELLFRARARRPAPGRDPKRVAAWNGYVATGLARAGAVLGDDALLQSAERCARFLLESMRDEAGHVRRVLHADHPEATGTGMLEDVGAVLDACLEVYVCGGTALFFEAAVALAHDLVERFWDPTERDFFMTPSDGEALVLRPRAEQDGATPHASARAARSLVRLAALTDDREWLEIARALLRTHAGLLERMPEFLPSLARVAALVARGPTVAVVCEAPARPRTGAAAGSEALLRATLAHLGPDDLLVRLPGDGTLPAGLSPAWAEGRSAQDGVATAFICRGQTCSLPITDASALAAAEEWASPSASVRAP